MTGAMPSTAGPTVSPAVTIDRTDPKFLPFAEKMDQHGVPPLVAETFRHYYSLLIHGESGIIPRSTIKPIREGELLSSEELSKFIADGKQAAKHAVIVKLNGGLGTSMGLSRAKSLLQVRSGLTFLDIIARQVIHYRKLNKVELPIVFMNSFSTEADTLPALAKYKDLEVNAIPLSFVQNKFPRIDRDGFSPTSWPANPGLEWNPPGHGDIYPAMATSGILKKLLDAGFLYAFISNADNLGAYIDDAILGFFAKKNLPFMMEVADRTCADRKGGHLARLSSGQLTLREIAQCPPDEIEEFLDISLFRYFNTNNLWINLKALQEHLSQNETSIRLPMIRNEKKVDSADDSSPWVYQLEVAAGAAISVYKGAAAIRVPRSRFAPVKTCHDLFRLWSDCYVITDEFRVVPNPKRKLDQLPTISLEEQYYKNIEDLRARLRNGVPSLLECKSVEIQGDVTFGKGVVFKGHVKIVNRTNSQALVPDGSHIKGEKYFG